KLLDTTSTHSAITVCLIRIGASAIARLRKPDALSSGDRHRRYVRSKDLLSLKLPRSLLVRLDLLAKGRGWGRAEALAEVLTGWDEREAAAAAQSASAARAPAAKASRRPRPPSKPTAINTLPAPGEPVPKARGTRQPLSGPRQADRSVTDASAIKKANGQPADGHGRSKGKGAAVQTERAAKAGGMDDLFGDVEPRALPRGTQRLKR
ncbi:MAG: hypothetical protein JWR10_4811, partial [Rubritepida sp.]|nr:hypothetical protein [Rubritepida sp.]